MELETLERQLQEASKARETKLRKAGIAGRVALATQLKMLDADVITLSRLLAVRTLQLEMEYVYKSIEDEALDIAPDELVEQGLCSNSAGQPMPGNQMKVLLHL